MDEYRTKAVIDANKGVTNVLESETIHTDLANVYDKIYNTLKAHFGPYSKFAVLIDPSDVLADPVFTKDGINIVRAIEFASPMEEEVKKMVAYIGTRMETAVGDGTTSAMMFTCAVLKKLMTHLYSNEYEHFSLNELRREYDNIVAHIERYIDDHKITWQSLMEREHLSRQDAVYRLVFAQAYSSSHGDVELADAVAKIFSGTPPESWKCMTFQRRTYESENRFDIEESEGQFELKCDPIVKSVFNMEMGTWLEYDDAILCIVNDSVRFESPAYDSLKMIYQYGLSKSDDAKRDKPMVLICHNRIDGTTYNELIEMVKESHDTKYPFTVFTADVEHPTCNEITVLKAVAGFDPSIDKEGLSFVDNVYVKYKGDKLVLDRLYNEPVYEDGEYAMEHPYIKDPKYDYYTHLLEIFDELQSGYDRLKMSPKEKKDQSNYRRLYNKLRYTKQKYLVIGGSSYDNLAMFDVVDDVITACSIALQEGVVPACNRMIFFAVDNMRESFSEGLNERRYHIFNSIATSVQKAIIEMAKTSISYAPKGTCKMDDQDGLTEHYWITHCVDIIDFDGKAVSLNEMFKGDDNMCKLIVQPANADVALMKRFGELALKFVLAERIIMRGGAYLGGAKK